MYNMSLRGRPQASMLGGVASKEMVDCLHLTPLFNRHKLMYRSSWPQKRSRESGLNARTLHLLDSLVTCCPAGHSTSSECLNHRPYRQAASGLQSKHNTIEDSLFLSTEDYLGSRQSNDQSSKMIRNASRFSARRQRKSFAQQSISQRMSNPRLYRGYSRSGRVVRRCCPVVPVWWCPGPKCATFFSRETQCLLSL
jgi:hypothetical protein